MYFDVKVKQTAEDSKGRMKTQTVTFLVEAVSLTDVDAKIAEEYEGYMGESEIFSVKQSKVILMLDGKETEEK